MARMKILWFFLMFSFSNCDPRRNSRYQPPKPRFEVFDPVGLIVWINADPGISSFTFHGKLNQKFSLYYDVGRWAQTVTKIKNGRYLFIDREAKLVPGDTIYYRTVIVRNGQTYRTNSGSFTVQQLRPASTTPTPSSSFAVRSADSDLDVYSFRTNERRAKDVRSTGTQTDDFEARSVDRNCLESKTVVSGRKVCAGQLIFEENFIGQTLDQRKWIIENRFASEPDNEFVVYADFSDNLQIKNGLLAIRPTLFEEKFGPGSTNKQFRFAEECTGERTSRDCIRDTQLDFDMIPPILSAQISTKNSFQFSYGKIVIKAKLPQGSWIFPQLYLLPATHFYGRDEYASGLMRVAFVPGGPRFRNTLSGGMILNNKEPLRCSKMCTLKRNAIQWNNNFHEYGIKWTPDGVWMEVDGEIYCTIDPGDGLYLAIQSHEHQIANLWRLSGNRIAPFDKAFYLSLGVGVGGHYDFHQFDEKPWKDLGVKAMYTFWNARDTWYPTWSSNSTMLVDYVRVYAI